MTKPEGPRKGRPKLERRTLASAVGGLPLPPKLAKPPATAVHRHVTIAPPRPSASKPHPPKPPKRDATTRPSVAGRLGAFVAGKR